MKNLTILLALALCACEPTLTVEPCDTGALLEDAGPSEPDRGFDARAACGIVGSQYQLLGLRGDLDFASCPQLECPFPYDNTGRMEVTCDPEAIEVCFWALAGANDCETYQDAMELCDPESCR